ncbi:MAG: hypothetical protein LBH74_00995 [Nitrososphaerota archaeon]|jgi:membrane protein YqaA with SNARE-associated domain|uniref:hypothetical protein n=1 Tax=Candidatus Bathycorpusculum sp. TaxID=2994959 RepID=UPI00281B5A5E|nr:hypothetical protein [Candidatus Termitimicrobium sp.]MCL2431073.1 hypothetical protein [Candidatus Termitimicrobium sp.]MDR0492208.1 hypothetical protein [Nitrososphaerota archaeon]
MPIDFIIVFATSFGFNLIPFAGPSNVLIASTLAIGLGATDPLSFIFIGGVLALGSALAKGIHYMVTFFISGRFLKNRRSKLDADAVKIRRWAFPLLFIAAVTPIPDEPIVIALGLMKYSPSKFFGAYFLGKFGIGVMGAFLGGFAINLFGDFLSIEVMAVMSIVMTVVITIILLKVDLGKLAEKYLSRKPKVDQEKTK